MLYAILSCILINVLWISSSFANSLWEGKWEMGRYTPAISGYLDIYDCSDSECHFRINSVHGVHICDVENVMKIDKNHARFYIPENDDSQFLAGEILFDLDPDKKIIDVQHKSGQLCGMRGVLEGIYEHETLPYRYPTSFDCWSDDLNQTEIAICASRRLSKADIEFDVNYKSFKTPEWFDNRNKCQKDEKCLWKFYKKSIYEAFEKTTNSSFNFLNYIRNQKQKWYYPTDLALLLDYFTEYMEEPYFSAWTITLDDDSYTEACDNCLAKYYGVAGLYTIYESALYIDDKEQWISFISANLNPPEDKMVIVFAPEGKSLNDMPAFIKEYTENLVKRCRLSFDNIKLMFFKSEN